MKRDIALAWAAHLRSGLVQCRGHMGASNGARCVLGALMDLAVKAGVVPPPVAAYESQPPAVRGEWPRVFGSAICHPRVKWGEDSFYPPIEVMEWAGMRTRIGLIPEEPALGLAGMNDRGVKFPIIAEIIDERWNEL